MAMSDDTTTPAPADVPPVDVPAEVAPAPVDVPAVTPSPEPTPTPAPAVEDAASAPDVYDVKAEAPETTVPDEQGAADYATALKATMFGHLYDPATLSVEGIDFTPEVPEVPAGDPNFLSGS